MTLQIVLDHTRLAAVLCIDTDRSLEPIPQAFRMQSQLTFVVPYTEYLAFLSSAQGVDEYLYKPVAEALKRPVRSYYMDVARAVLKECYFSVQNDRAPTHIRHYFYDVPIGEPGIDYREKEDAFDRYAESLGLGFAKLPYVRDEWEYALKLGTCGVADTPIYWNKEELDKHV